MTLEYEGTQINDRRDVPVGTKVRAWSFFDKNTNFAAFFLRTSLFSQKLFTTRDDIATLALPRGMKINFRAMSKKSSINSKLKADYQQFR